MTTPDGAERWYGAVLGAGFDAIVNERANRMRFPRGRRRYDVATVAELVRLRPRAYTMRLDGEVHEFDAVLVAIGNTASYGGGHRICPAADPTDGLLDVVVAGPMSRRGGTCDTSSFSWPVTQWMGASKCVPTCSPPSNEFQYQAGPRSS